MIFFPVGFPVIFFRPTKTVISRKKLIHTSNLPETCCSVRLHEAHHCRGVGGLPRPAKSPKSAGWFALLYKSDGSAARKAALSSGPRVREGRGGSSRPLLKAYEVILRLSTYSKPFRAIPGHSKPCPALALSRCWNTFHKPQNSLTLQKNKCIIFFSPTSESESSYLARSPHEGWFAQRPVFEMPLSFCGGWTSRPRAGPRVWKFSIFWTWSRIIYLGRVSDSVFYFNLITPVALSRRGSLVVIVFFESVLARQSCQIAAISRTEIEPFPPLQRIVFASSFVVMFCNVIIVFKFSGSGNQVI